jgi:biopolymer transport protein ExbD
VKIGTQRGSADAKVELQIAPLIDVVFLLLIYFMVTASLIKKEGDISFILPATVAQPEKMDVPVEVLIEIDADGTVILEGMQFPWEDRDLGDLANHIRGLKQIAVSQKAPFFVNVIPEKGTLHKRVIDVMDACAAAEVDNLSFSKSM